MKSRFWSAFGNSAYILFFALGGAVFAATALASGSGLGRFPFHDKALIAPADRGSAAALGQKYGVPSFAGKSYVDLVEAVYKAQGQLSEGKAASEKMGQFGLELDRMISGLPSDTRTGVQFSVAEAVELLEAFSDSEFADREKFKFESDAANYVHFWQFPEYAEAYIDKKPPVAGRNYDQVRGMLTRSDIRDSSSFAMWPLLLGGHDIRHVHFVAGHPRAGMVYFLSARSRLPLRWVLVSAVFEGVDNVQNHYETSLCKYMARDLKLNLEQAMIYLAKSPPSELEHIAQQAGDREEVSRHEEEFASWRPHKSSEHGPTGRSGSLTADLEKGVRDLLTWAKAPGHARFANYARLPDEGGSKFSDEAIHW